MYVTVMTCHSNGHTVTYSCSLASLGSICCLTDMVGDIPGGMPFVVTRLIFRDESNYTEISLWNGFEERPSSLMRVFFSAARKG